MTVHGGKRQGAGRKTGAASKSNEEARLKAAATGETPLEYMLRVMRDDATDGQRRDDMAKAAAPYVHAKLASVELTGANGGPIEHSVTNDAERFTGSIASLVAREGTDEAASGTQH